MKAIYLFDWGDTLMVDFADEHGKMCHQVKVKAVDGAIETLTQLSHTADIYIATGAADSTEGEIKIAFKRVGLDPFIKGYFCKANLGFSKGEVEFLPTIISKLGAEKSQVTMVGDSLLKDIQPALAAGINAIWLTEQHRKKVPHGASAIQHLNELCLLHGKLVSKV